jgi:hypothetical protein
MTQTWMRLLRAGLRRAVYALAALPVALCCLGLIVIGRGGAAVSVRLRSLRLAGLTISAAPTTGRLTSHVVLSLPIDVVAFAVAGYVWLLLPMNLLYPVRLAVYDESPVGSWGGPTMAGAWAVHAAGGLLIFIVIGLPLIAGLVQVQSWVAERTLARRPFGVPAQPPERLPPRR